MNQKINQIPFKDNQGEDKTLKDFDAKAYLIVNVASKCGLTPQYEGLQALYAKFKDQGLEVLAFPANEFLGQEPGSNDEIQNFCSINYNVTFPVNHKIVVKGDGQHPLYQALTRLKPDAVKNEAGDFEKLLTGKGLITGEAHEIKWNFEKFLINAEGEVVQRFFPDITAEDPRLLAELQAIL